MSGTSLDGVDGVLADFQASSPQVLAHASLEFAADLRAEFLALNVRGGADELHRAALAGNALAELYARVVQRLLQDSGLPASRVRAVGAHGQTVRHQPRADAPPGYTIQINNPALLAERVGIDVVADFRSRDVAALGQGAPLVPAFHQGFFGDAQRVLAVLNIGGISNLSVLRPGAELIGFDCGPGNLLLDAWCQQHLGQRFDRDGAWAASGQAVPALLARLYSDAFFSAPPPKSTGRDHFHSRWLAHHLSGFPPLQAADVQASLVELSAQSCAQALQRHAPEATELIVCGGGALNGYLMRRLQALCAPLPVCTSEQRGIAPLQVEACAFAWLAWRCMQRQPGNAPSVTGANGLRVLGAIYPH